jgi:hypothetical protein
VRDDKVCKEEKTVLGVIDRHHYFKREEAIGVRVYTFVFLQYDEAW